jgi:hypothetical protein
VKAAIVEQAGRTPVYGDFKEPVPSTEDEASVLRDVYIASTAAKISLFDHLVGESTRVLAPPIAHGTNDRAEIATLCGEDVLGSRGTHRIEASLDDAILLKRPQTLR